MSKSSSQNQSKENKPVSYAGRWVAKLWGRIVGQGSTPKQALNAAQANRHKETPEVTYIPTQNQLTFPPLVEQVKQAVNKNYTIYLVGGAVRDAFLNKKSNDLDFALPKDALKIARKVANALEGAYYKLDDEHQTGRVVVTNDLGERTILDFAAYRGDNLESDLRGRDFTINAFAVNLHNLQEIHDPLGGISDLIQKKLIACSDSSISDDPVRAIRAIRFATAYGLSISPNTNQLIKSSAKNLSEISPERIRDELFKLMDSPNPATSFRVLEMLNVLEHILPDLINTKGFPLASSPHTDLWDHSLNIMKSLEEILSILNLGFSVDEDKNSGNLSIGLISLHLGRFREPLNLYLNEKLSIERSPSPIRYFSSLYLGVGKINAATKSNNKQISYPNYEDVSVKLGVTRAKSLHFSNSEINRIKSIIQFHNLPNQLIQDENSLSNLSIYRYFKKTGAAGITIALLSLADLLACYQSRIPPDRLTEHLEMISDLFNAYFEHHDEIVDPIPLIDGNILMRKLKFKPGPKIGEILEMLLEAQVAGDITTINEALEYAEKYK